MSGPSNGVIRVKTKGRTKFAIGDDDDPRELPVFEVDVVREFQSWIEVDEAFRPEERNDDGMRPIPPERMQDFYNSAVEFVERLGGEQYKGKVTPAEALDLIARLREKYDELADFFQPKLRRGAGSPDSSEEESTSTSQAKSMVFTTEDG